MWTRRRVQVALVVVGSVLVARGLAIAPHARDDQPAVTAIPDFKVTLLGTGTPNPRPDRFGPSTLVEAGPERLVFDCGRSCTTRLWQLKIPLGTVKLFITHLHSDHTVGIPDLWLTGWLTQPYGTRKAPFRVWGPEGTVAMMSNLEKSYEADIHIRQPQGAAAAIDAKDFTEGVVYQENGVRVTAFKVAHADINAFGFRIDYKGHSVVLSGDTRTSENLIRHAQNVDLLIHEVASPETFQRAGAPPERTTSILAHRTQSRRERCLRGRSLSWRCIHTSCCQTPPSRI